MVTPSRGKPRKFHYQKILLPDHTHCGPPATGARAREGPLTLDRHSSPYGCAQSYKQPFVCMKYVPVPNKNVRNYHCRKAYIFCAGKLHIFAHNENEKFSVSEWKPERKTCQALAVVLLPGADYCVHAAAEIFQLSDSPARGSTSVLQME